MEFAIAAAHEAIAAAVPERECIVFRDRRLTFTEVTDRTRRLANALLDRGFGCHTERTMLEPWESGQDHVALYLRNGPEYLEGMLGAFKARAAPFNVNYRYVAGELRALLADSRARVVVYHAEFAPDLATVLPELETVELLVQVADDSGEALLPGAVEYEALLASSRADRPPVEWSPDDLYIAYTGGTTGLPKGVLWRGADIFVAALGGADPVSGVERLSYEELATIANEPRVFPYLIPVPFMHVAGHWLAWLAWAGGDSVVIPPIVDRFDPECVIETVESERIGFLIIVGNAFGRPLADVLRTTTRDLSSLRIISTGGAAMTVDVKQELLDRLPRLRLLDTVGSSETGNQARTESTAGGPVVAGVFRPGPTSGVISESMDRRLEPGDPGTGWLARWGRVPLGYLGDEAKTRSTFPTIEGTRHSVPGDRARLDADGMMHLLGRDSMCVNTGGEKVFVEEVEAALHSHAAVADVVVCGRPSPRWGSEVVAIVQVTPGSTPTADELVAHAAESLARYKLPKDVVFVDRAPRGPNGKADYRVAAELAAGSANHGASGVRSS